MVNEIKSMAGKIGGRRRMELYGNPGTPKGRRLGGLNSRKTHKLNPTSPFNRRPFQMPRKSLQLAELVGVILGDGCITARQVGITLHKYDDLEYANYVASLLSKLFKLTTKVKERPHKNVCVVLISRTSFVDYLGSIGMSPGNKVKQQIDVPKWVKAGVEYRKSCLRGLFDTDGCFFVDKHVIKGKEYRNAGMNFTNRSLPLLNFFKNSLAELGFSPVQISKFSVVLRKENDIVGYFREIRSSNPKHLGKFQRFFIEKYGRVPKRS